MISKEEREKDKAVLAAATPDWQQGHHVGEPKALCSARAPDDSLLMLDKDGMAIFWRVADAEAAVTARNRLPLYIADAEEMEQRIEALLEAARLHESGEIRIDADGQLPPEVSRALDNTAASVLRLAVKILRGGQ